MLLLFLNCAAPTVNPVAPAATAVPVEVEQVAPQGLDRLLDAVGTVSTLDAVDIRSEMSGLVEEVLFHDGQSVHKGDALLRLRSIDAQAGVKEAQARAHLASLALERSKTLLAKGDVSQAEVDRATADQDLAQAALSRAQEVLRRCTLRAPFDGLLGRRDVSPGQTIDTIRVLTRIESQDHLFVDVALPEASLATVAAGQKANLTIDALDLSQEAVVSFISPRVNEGTRTVELRVAIQNPDPRLRPGMSASLHILTEHLDNALMVPTEALVPGAKGMLLWIVGPDGTVAQKPVSTGTRTTNRIEIKSGLSPGDTVVIQGLSRLKNGAKVETRHAPD